MRQQLSARRSRALVVAVSAALALGLLTAPPGLASAQTTAGKHTVRTVIRPVEPNGRPAPHYRVTNYHGPRVDCSFPEPSIAAESRNILWCAPDADHVVACWRAASRGYVLCLDQVPSHRLTRFSVSGVIAHAPRSNNLSPLALRLANGTQCTFRDGGAAGGWHGKNHLYATYWCTHNRAVWSATARRAGINESSALWTVRVGSADGTGKLVHADVTRAWFVGTHHGPKAKATGSWRAPRVVVTTSSLGAARVNMTEKRARRVTGVKRFVAGGDGAYFATGVHGFSAGAANLEHGRTILGCYAAFQNRLAPDIVTSAGVALGDSLKRLEQVYGRRLHYTRGVMGQAGRIPGRYVTGRHGTLFFVMQYGYIWSISVLAPGLELRPC